MLNVNYVAYYLLTVTYARIAHTV